MWLLGLFSSISILLTVSGLHAQTNLAQVENMQASPRRYGVMKTNMPIAIDGKDDEKAWALAPWTEAFVDIEGDAKAVPVYTTKVKMLWDDTHLFIYARMEEPHVWGYLTKRDTIIYHDNDFEIFIKPFEQPSFYYEIEVNPLNTILDLVMPKPYRFGGDALMHWDVKNLKSAVHVEGTLNDPDDTDQYWSIEMAIPFNSLTTFSRKAIPKLGDYWRINFSRVQWQHELNDGAYSRKTKNNKLMPEDNWVWSPIGIINMHYPERWGYLKFIDSSDTEVAFPRSYDAEKAVWNIFYLQQLYKQEHKHFAAGITELKGYQRLLDMDRTDLIYEIFSNRREAGYVVEVKDLKHRLTVTLDNFGHYTINYE
ncbi:carbohydrate-binding family 9-like protein [Sphingobacterium haloxyli]|uniref:Carbohydrate-binding domain-containing protein n=1 Tax=Sphingobacterium haloxyli TaxID=2100533 RepID=A0A2S9J8M8_9SPHI|nr:carbohydrate-binding family 9-like protein [Sphingobacterium haloxyli]PRD49138.1 hypothetical protein C5745_00380 [Sphingobacterium haloxyli]